MTGQCADIIITANLFRGGTIIISAYDSQDFVFGSLEIFFLDLEMKAHAGEA